ncbi:hypothetical protein BaRGS_00002075, partial [Batillaria attramentaria]
MSRAKSHLQAPESGRLTNAGDSANAWLALPVCRRPCSRVKWQEAMMIRMLPANLAGWGSQENWSGA